MVRNGFAAAILAAAFSVPAFAQTVASIGGPAEIPPASYKADQYVDSRGCVFMRAGFGGRVTWVPRVGADRKPMCGVNPTFAPVVIEVAEDEAPVVPAQPARPAPPAQETLLASVQPAKPAPAPVVVVPTAPQTRVAAAAPAPAQPARTAQPAYEAVAAGPGKGKIGCYTSAPVPMVVRLSTGGTAVVCTRGDGTTTGWRPPLYPAGTAPGAALGYVEAATRGTATAAVAPAASAAPPKGYKLAWEDDRLNPLRGQGTANGQAMQDQVWTRTTPATLVEAAPAPAKTAKSTVAAMNPAQAAAQPATAARSFVQVGSFGVASNAEGAVARLQALGLPVARGSLTRNGKALTVVYAGPFTSAGAAEQALRAARGAGFSDAFIR